MWPNFEAVCITAVIEDAAKDATNAYDDKLLTDFATAYKSGQVGGGGEFGLLIK